MPDVAVTALIESVSFSSSVSLLNTFILVAEASSKMVVVSGLATGASFTGVTVIVNTPLVVSVPSLRV